MGGEKERGGQWGVTGAKLGRRHVEKSQHADSNSKLRMAKDTFKRAIMRWLSSMRVTGRCSCFWKVSITRSPS